MALINITGGKYTNQALSAVGTTTVTIATATFVSGDFNPTQRMVALFSSAGAFKGIAWVRRFTSTTVLELENQFVDPVTGLFATQAVGDIVMVSRNASETANTADWVVSGIPLSVTTNDALTFGTTNTNMSVCFYEENMDFNTRSHIRCVGGVVVFGKLIAYDGVSKESFLWTRECNIKPRSDYLGSGSGGANAVQYNVYPVGTTAGHAFMFGGMIGGTYQSSNFIGSEGLTGLASGSFAFFGTRLNYGCSSPSNGGAWPANPTRHLLYKTIHEARYTNANLVIWGDGSFQGSYLAFPQIGTGSPLGVFRANTVYNVGAATNNRTIVSDLGSGTFIDAINGGDYRFTNVITPAVTVSRYPGSARPIQFSFSDDYTNLKTNTTVVLRRTVDSVVASSVVNTTNSTFTATALQSTYSATANGAATQTANYTSFDYTVKCYGYQAISGNHSTVTYSLGTAGNGTNLKLGGLINQVADSTVTLTLAQALALSSKISGNSTTGICTISGSSTLDEQYDYLVAWGSSSATLAQYPSLSSYPIGASGSTSQQLMQLYVQGGATLSAGAKLSNMSGDKHVEITGTNSTATFNRATITWNASTYQSQWFLQLGGTLTLANDSLFTINATTGLGYDTKTMFGANTTLNLTESDMVFNAPSGATSYNGSVFSAFQANGTATMNITNGTWTINGPTAGSTYVIHTYWSAASAINGFTINGTAASAVALEMGATNQKLTNLTHAGQFNGSSNGTNKQFYVFNDMLTYTGATNPLNASTARLVKWVWLDPVRTDGNLFRWAVGTQGATGASGQFGVVYFRPTITIDKAGYAPKLRLTPSTLSSRYASKTIQTTELSTVAASSFYTDSGFGASDGGLPFVDSLDSKIVINTIDWTLDVRQAGWQDQSITFTAATAKKGLITKTFSGVEDAYYVNASTGLADSALISVNTSTKTISAVSGSLTWSPQRLYNALKNWWATYASDTDFLSTTSGSTLKLGDYNVASNISFVEGNSNDVLTAISTTGLINAATNEIPVTDSRGTSTIWQFENIAVGSSIVIYDASGVTKYFQQEVTTAGNYIYYIPPGTTGTYSWAIELYGKQRQSGSFAANTGGLLFYEPIYVEDVGITETTKATVAAYTAIETSSKFYDRTAYFRLSEQGIKLGQIVTRAGTSLEIGTFSHLINKDSASVYSITGSVITTKSTSYAGDSKYTTEIATPPATITANSTEVITIAIEDANGNSSLTINGGDGTFQLWKVTTSTATADYATGTLLATVGNVTYRFIGVTGYDIIGVDINSNIRRRTSMAKGIYTQAFYVGDQIQLAQAPQVEEILTKVEVMQIDVDAIQAKTDGLTFTIPNVLDANIQYVNDIEVKGTGEDNDPWNPV